MMLTGYHASGRMPDCLHSGMTFDESNVKRDKDGKFGHKEGSAPSVSLPTRKERKTERLTRRDEARLAMAASGYDPENPSDDPVAADRYLAAEFRELEALTEQDVDSAWKQAPAYIAPFLAMLETLPVVSAVSSSVSLAKYRGEQAQLRRLNELRAISARRPELRELNLMTMTVPEGRLETLDGRVSAWLKEHGRPNPAAFQKFARTSTWENPPPEVEKALNMARNAVVAARFAYLNDDPEAYQVPHGNWEMASGLRGQGARGGLVD